MIGFKSVNIGPGFFLFDSYQLFVSHDLPEVSISVRNEAPVQLESGIKTFETGFWSFYETQQGCIIRMNTRSRGIFPRLDTLVFSPGRDQADLYVEQDLAAARPILPGIEVPPFILDEMMATSFLLPRTGLHFHACGVKAWGERGFMFAGYSGSGKSTLARIWRDSNQATLLSDERVAVRRKEDQYRLFGTPWCSPVDDFCSPEKARLERIFIVEHAAQNKARRLRPAAAVAALAARAFLPFWNPKMMAQALEILDGITQSIPCYALGFVPDDSVIDYIQCLKD